jgi:hypothetical protein
LAGGELSATRQSQSRAKIASGHVAHVKLI